ncbi:hypothetical protein ACIBQ6_21855 [Nonomuraea sp. NPDC049655]|uniref:hypothetical protein n=1 Tax=Nonomuraea sp. NPDC049655 TaxID=3364355 RepID=UPI0037AE6D64
MTDLRRCCQQAVLDGETPEEHYPRCDARAEPPTPPLFALAPVTPEEGGGLL